MRYASSDYVDTQTVGDALIGFDVRCKPVGYMALVIVSLIGAYEEAFEHDEPRIRMALGVYQDTWLRAHRDGSATSPRLRQGRRMRWLDTVLQPLALSDDRRQLLKTALALAVGPDSLIILKDVCGLSSTEASATLRRAALALLRAELREEADPRT